MLATPIIMGNRQDNRAYHDLIFVETGRFPERKVLPKKPADAGELTATNQRVTLSKLVCLVFVQ
jgi:hypothetical protein